MKLSNSPPTKILLNKFRQKQLVNLVSRTVHELNLELENWKINELSILEWLLHYDADTDC